MMAVLHSEAFVDRWRTMLRALYGYRDDAGALSVPGITGARTAVYLPLLNYTDLPIEQAELRRRQWEGRAYQLRALDLGAQTFEKNDTVTMRLSLAGMSSDQVFRQRIPSKCRNQIRKAEKVGLRLVEGCEGVVVDDFYEVFAATMHRYGTPVFSPRLFRDMGRFVDGRFLVAYQAGRPVAGLCLVLDEQLAWVPWAGSLPAFRSLCPNHLIYWRAIQTASEQGKQLFDFGRSGFEGPTYAFKREWGAQPVRIVTLAQQRQDVYAKYSLASNVWKRLPRALVDTVGPRLCRFLPDL